jgi:hypothetical protein
LNSSTIFVPLASPFAGAARKRGCRRLCPQTGGPAPGVYILLRIEKNDVRRMSPRSTPPQAPHLPAERHGATACGAGLKGESQ